MQGVWGVESGIGCWAARLGHLLEMNGRKPARTAAGHDGGCVADEVNRSST